MPTILSFGLTRAVETTLAAPPDTSCADCTVGATSSRIMSAVKF
jgi:hypothetical protein